ncbi:MAG: endonuclease/exonuclease/phosphatase family protein [Gemmataceae bacterium]
MRLLTYNIHKGVGGTDRRYRLQRIVDVIRHEQPDLVCLQEVDYNVKRSRFDDQPDILADKLAATAAVYQLNHPHRDGGYGNLILSRWPFHEQEQVSLRYQDRKNRGAQLVVVDTPEGPLHLVNWHLGLAETERRWQVGYLLQHPLFQRAADMPTLIAGDYNDWRNTLGKHQFHAYDFHQVTNPTHTYRTFPAFFPVASLDKVYRRGAVKVKHSHIVRHRLARRASDHLPLVIDFHLAPRKPRLIIPGG